MPWLWWWGWCWWRMWWRWGDGDNHEMMTMMMMRMIRWSGWWWWGGGGGGVWWCDDDDDDDDDDGDHDPTAILASLADGVTKRQSKPVRCWCGNNLLLRQAVAGEFSQWDSTFLGRGSSVPQLLTSRPVYVVFSLRSSFLSLILEHQD